MHSARRQTPRLLMIGVSHLLCMVRRAQVVCLDDIKYGVTDDRVFTPKLNISMKECPGRARPIGAVKRKVV